MTNKTLLNFLKPEEIQTLFTDMVETSQELIWQCDKDGRSIYLNPAWEEATGYRLEEMIGQSLSNFQPPEIAKRDLQEIPHLLNEGILKGYETIHLSKTGEELHLLLNAKLLFDEKGLIVGARGTASNITERRRVEEEFKKSEFYLNEIENIAKLGRWKLDPAINIMQCSDITLKIFEFDPKLFEIPYEAFIETIHPEDREKVNIVHAESVKTKNSYETAYRLLMKDGRIKWVNEVCRTDCDPHGHAIRSVGTVEEVTDCKLSALYHKLSVEVLAILNKSADFKESIQQILTAVKQSTGCDAAGIRLESGEDFPYFLQNGFSNDFILTENTLIERDPNDSISRNPDGTVSLECTCGLVISGKFDPSNPLFTAGGSSWTNDSLPFLDVSLEDDPRHNPRNQCIHKGYASVALVPIRTKDRIVGLLQINGHKKGLFTLDAIYALESIASHIGEAIMRKQAEDALEASQLNRQIISGAQEGIIVYDCDLRFLVWNPYMEKLSNIAASDVIGRHPLEVFPILKNTGLIERLEKVLAGENPETQEFPFGGSELDSFLWVADSSSPLRNTKGEITGIISTVQNITNRKMDEKALKKTLEERETLLRELYHRTKNNMGVINGLLSLQASYFENDNLKEAFDKAQDRIRAMALVHEKLYQSSDLSVINLREYILDLFQLLLDSYMITGNQVTFNAEMADVFVLIDTAIPCGLVLSELISNALKYAFPGETKGHIGIFLRRLDNGEIQIRVNDDGVGFPPGFDARRDGNMGFQTVFALVEQQLQGSVSFEIGHDLSCILNFKDDLYQKRV
jgi:PAS domain S-box-containing protein